MNLVQNLEKLRDKATKKAQQRDKVFLKRSEQWQRSPEGVLYESQTQVFSDTIFKIEDAISEARNLTNPIL